ncbi:S8 family serine peptidase [Oceanobacillus sp. 143]|nr:S8 family serine peptidase [Oceanobacillus sp. 143]
MGDIYIKAIDDSIILGADVINMSLGSTAAFVDETDPEQQAIKNAVENGVLMSISAGNSAHLGNGFYNPYASNPDIGVVGSPGLSYDSLQVASIEILTWIWMHLSLHLENKQDLLHSCQRAVFIQMISVARMKSNLLELVQQKTLLVKI